MILAVVETSDLTKIYGDIVAVNSLNLRVDEGEIFGFLGPNGSGKTTTILMLMGLTEPSSGIAKVCGFNATRETLKVKRLAGYLPENVGFYEDLTADQTLRYTARLNGIPDQDSSRRIEELLSKVGLSDATCQRVGEFSRGMKQRLGIADVLIKEPRLVFLDEPTMGIDPEGVKRILDIIVGMSREQKITIFLSSHLLYQVQRICDRVGILFQGRMVAEGSIERLGREVLGQKELTIEVQASKYSKKLLNSIKKIEGVTDVERSGDLLLVGCERDVRQEISRTVHESGGTLIHLRMPEYALEEIYMRYFREA